MKRTRHMRALAFSAGNIFVLGLAAAACEPGAEQREEAGPKPTATATIYNPYSTTPPTNNGISTAPVPTTSDEPISEDKSVCAIQYVSAPSCAQMKLTPNTAGENGNLCIKRADPVTVDKMNITQSFSKVTAAGQTGWVLRSELACQRP